MNFSFHQDIFSFVILAGVIEGVFLSVFFLFKDFRKYPSSLYMGCLLLLFAIHSIDFWAGYTFYTLYHPHWLDISVPFSLAMGPLVFQYTKAFLKHKNPVWSWIHYIPAFIFFGYSMFFYFQDAAFKRQTFISSRSLDLPFQWIVPPYSPDPLGIRNFVGIFISSQLLIYLGLSFYEYKKKRNTNVTITIHDQGMAWIRNILIATAFIIIVAFVIQILYPGGKDEFILAACFTGFIYFTSYKLLRNTEFFKNSRLIDKYAKSSLNELGRGVLIKNIEDYVQNDKSYLSNLFSLNKFSRAVGASPNHLSQVLNDHYKKNYFEFIADLRIREACSILTNEENSKVNIEEIAFRVGYNSKSAFNSAFKKIVHQTPLNYKKNSNSTSR